MIDASNGSLSIRSQCSLLGIWRSNIYYCTKDRPDEGIIANEIREIWLSMPCYGYRKITKELQRRNYKINHKRVQRLMREMRIAAIYPKPRTTLINSEHKKHPYLLKDLEITHPNQVWSTDITYIKIIGGFIYLIAIIDVYSRFIVSWSLSVTLEAEFCIDALDKALENWPKPEIINTDQGVQFTSIEWTTKLIELGIKISMDGVGRWADNIYIERFWRTIKYEYIFLYSFATIREARAAIGKFIHEYNHKRLHQSLKYQTPAEVYLK
ncbi:MAG TPA: IS3 family transposase [Nitrosopumilaceae archaeon]|jgi:putative transposase|nr:IS3 family transposase [Nitrosopumilaceae archaeon]